MRTAGSCGCLLLGANRKQPVLDGVTVAVAAAWQLKSCGQSSSKFGRRSAHRLQTWSGYRVAKPCQEGAALALQRQRCASLPGVMLDRARCVGAQALGSIAFQQRAIASRKLAMAGSARDCAGP